MIKHLKELHKISEIISVLIENDEYEGLEDNDEFVDEEDEEAGPQMESSIKLLDGSSFERWIVSSEYEYRINGEPINDGPIINLLCTQLPDRIIHFIKVALLNNIDRYIKYLSRCIETQPNIPDSAFARNWFVASDDGIELKKKLFKEKKAFEKIKNYTIDEFRSKPSIVILYLNGKGRPSSLNYGGGLVWDIVSDIFDEYNEI